MKRGIFGLLAVLLSVALALVVLELVSIAVLSAKDGHYSSAEALFGRSQNTFIRDLTGHTGCLYVDRLFPHPYLAFVHSANPPCGVANVNNVGLFNDDFPTVKRTDRYVVLLTGGSVASQVGQFAPAPAPRFLQDALNERYVSPNGKPILVLNGADGAWNEPQQLILFAMYATSVDAVVTLDGFNEHFAFMPGSRVRLELPGSNFMAINPFAAGKFGDAAIGWMLGRTASAIASNPVLRHSHLAYMVAASIEAAARRRENIHQYGRTSLYGFFVLPPEISSDPQKLFDLQLSLYQNYERDIEAIARDKNVKTAYFLQPVPAWDKPLTAEEKKDAGDLSYADIYRRIVAGMMTLRNDGLAIYDLGDIYKNETGPIYADPIHCRHDKDWHSRGYEIMAAKMADDIGAAWGLARRSPEWSAAQ
jgi:hypothetical protein